MMFTRDHKTYTTCSLYKCADNDVQEEGREHISYADSASDEDYSRVSGEMREGDMSNN